MIYLLLKMIKKSFPIVILLMLALLACGCGSKQAQKDAEAEVTDSTAKVSPTEETTGESKGYDLAAIGKAIEGCEMLKNFHNGIADVKKDGKWFCIDRSGRVVDEPPRQEEEGLHEVVDQKTGLRGFADKTGKVIIDYQFDYVGQFSEGLCWVCKKEPDNGIGFIDETGKLVIDYQFDWPGEHNPSDFHEGLCPVMVDGSREIFSYIDKTGKVAFPGVYSYEADFCEGLAGVTEVVSTDPYVTRSGYIDKTGKFVIEVEHAGSYCERFHDGVAKITKYGVPTYFIDKQGNKLFELDERFKYVEYSEEGTWRVYDGEHFGFIDNTGKLIVPCKYEARGTFSEGLSPVQDKNGGKWGFVDKEGHSTFE